VPIAFLLLITAIQYAKTLPWTGYS